LTPERAPHLSEWATASEVADTLGVSRQTVNIMIRRGDFATLHIVGTSMIRPMYVVQRTELLEMKATRVFPRSKPIPETEA